MKLKGVHIFIAIVVLSVTAALVAGFMAVGSPAAERARQLDMQRISELQQLSYSIDSFYNQADTKKLPRTFAELRNHQNVYVGNITDPETGAPYEYSIGTDGAGLAYQLCATFSTEVNTVSGTPRPVEDYPNPGSSFWDHPIGRKCFDLKVNVNLNNPKPVM